MEIYQTYKALPEMARGGVIAIGNFDGVHKGHQILLARTKAIAADLGKPFAVLTFEPHPRSIFRPDDPPFRLATAETKAERLKAEGVDLLFALKFNWDFASLSHHDFISQVLKSGLGAAHVVVGEDFCFGQLRKGTPNDMEKAGIAVTTLSKEGDGAEVYSSSRVRQALRHGKIEEANAVLGWEWEVRGVVVEGDKRGRTIGYPTANVKLGDHVHPAYGIYATRVQIEGEDEWLPSATNIGIRPMFEIPTAQVEAHIFDFDRDIYGKTIRIRPVKRLRGEAKFDSLEALIAQIDADCEEAKKVLA